MSTKRDLVEAHGYNRRRLVTAFVSGAPGGREVEPVRHGRTLVGGVVLALLIVAGAAVSGFLQKPPPDDWAQKSLVIGKDSGARFYAYEGTLFPVMNITSARLLMGEQLDPLTIDDELIAEAPAGPTVGIQGAPEVLPSTFVEDGWTACTSPAGGVLLSLKSEPQSIPASGRAVLVSSEDRTYLVAGRFRYPVPADDEGRSILLGLGFATEPVPVPSSWVNLFEEGGAITTPRVEGDGTPVATGVRGLNRVGTPIDVDGNTYVLGSGGTLVPTTAFVHEVLVSTRAEVSLAPADTNGLDGAPGSSVGGRDWPTEVPAPLTPSDSPCVRADLAPGQRPEVSLASPVSTAAVPTTSGVATTIDPGLGAVVRGVSGNVLNSGSVYLVDSSGTAFAVGEDGNGSALPFLGYDPADVLPLPQPWLVLLKSGPLLTPAEALPEQTGGTSG